MLDFKVYINKENDETKDPLVVLLNSVKRFFTDKEFSVELLDFNDKEVKEKAEELGFEDTTTTTLLLNRTKITGRVNEYFILATIAQILTKDGNDQKQAKFEQSGKGHDLRVRAVSEFLYYQSQMREDAKSFLMLIRESPDQVNVEGLKKAIDNGSTVYLLTNFRKGKQRGAISRLGKMENMLLGHIDRENLHMTMSVTIRKNRPFFGSFLRAKKVNSVWKGLWSPLLQDSVAQLKEFFMPLFQVASPVHLDGKIPEPPETNRVIAKVKDKAEELNKYFQ